MRINLHSRYSFTCSNIAVPGTENSGFDMCSRHSNYCSYTWHVLKAEWSGHVIENDLQFFAEVKILITSADGQSVPTWHCMKEHMEAVDLNLAHVQ